MSDPVLVSLSWAWEDRSAIFLSGYVAWAFIVPVRNYLDSYVRATTNFSVLSAIMISDPHNVHCKLQSMGIISISINKSSRVLSQI